MKITNLFGMQVYSLYEGEIVGTISGALFNHSQTKINAFKIFDQEENEYELLLSNIKAMTDCIVITNKNKLSLYSEQPKKSPMFKQVIDENGKTLGKIIDADIDENGNVINFITNSSVTIKPEHLYIRKSFIYYSLSPVTISNYRPRNKKVNTLSQIKVNILNSENAEDFLPKRIQYNPENIIGKVAKSDLFGINNEIVIKANQIITEKIIDDAIKHNRLNQLFYIAV